MTFKECLETNADFLNGNEGVIYCIQEYNKYIKDHGCPPDEGLKVVDCIDQSYVYGYVPNFAINDILKKD